MKDRFEAQSEWNKREMDVAERLLDRARRLDQIADRLNKKSIELDAIGNYNQRMSDLSHATRNKAGEKRRAAMQIIENVTQMMHKPATNSILEEMGYSHG